MLWLFRYGRLIDDQPIQTDGPNHIPKLLEVNRLLDEAVDPKVIAGHQVALFL
jgi:hypothetical protein